MALTQSNMVLYALTLQRAGAITSAVYGNFSAPKVQEIVVARGNCLELLRPEEESGKVQSVSSREVFGVIRTLVPFRLVGGNRDYLIVGSDSGRIVILQFDAEKNAFEKVHEETFGKSGCRRIVPGQYMAVDPKGRAAMIGAVEKQKFVYVLNRDDQARLIISSPLEAHKSHTLVFDLVGVDVGFENPVFAAIETDYEREEEEEDGKRGPSRFLTYYELDLGLNHVTRKWSERVDDTANKLITVPGGGGSDGPGGVLVVCENAIIYKDQDKPEVRAMFPRRFMSDDKKGLFIVSHTTHKQKGLFFFLLQSELGDIYKVTLTHSDGVVQDVHIKYFDTVPTTAAMCVLKTGFLFCASEFGNHYLFQVAGLGTDNAVETNKDIAEFTYFAPRKLTNLILIDEIESHSPILDIRVADLAREHTPQIYALCGRGHRSYLRVLRHGLPVGEMAVSDLPGSPNAVWAVKVNAADRYHKYIVVSFVNATIVLLISETGVQEINDSGILDNTPTLHVSTIGDDSLVQIHPNGIRLIRADKRIHEWKTPGRKSITKCTANARQVVIALTGGEVVYFELDRAGMLAETYRRDMNNDVASLSLAPVPPGRRGAMFLAVGSFDNTIRLFSLDPSDPMRQMSVQAVAAQPRSALLVDLPVVTGREQNQRTRLYLYAGLANGVLVRSQVDEATGTLSDMRKKFLGTKPVKLFEVSAGGRSAVIALSSRSWLNYAYQNRFMLTPLSYDELEFASAFVSEPCPEGIVAVTGTTLRILTVERLGEEFNSTSYPLRYTPRKMLVHPVTNQLIIIESDNNSYPYEERKELQASLKQMSEDVEMDGGDDGDGQRGSKRQRSENGDAEPEDEAEAAMTEAFIGPPRPGAGKWSSCIRILDPATGETLSLLELGENEAATSFCTLEFRDAGDELFLAVGTVQDLQLVPRSLKSAYIHLYRFVNANTALELLHKTPVEEPVLALAAFQKRLLVGVGKHLRIYDLGKKKLLRKSENKNFPTNIQVIHVNGERIYAGDQCEGFFYVKYIKSQKRLHIFSDSASPRFLTASTVLDYDTVAGADKFGNFFMSRLPANASEEAEAHLAASAWSSNTSAPSKLDDVIQYHVGDVITSMQRVSLVQGGAEVIFYGTIMGGLGMLAPFVAREDVDFFTHLEMHLRQELPPLLGRDHLAYRSYYFPVKDVVDGDLCEQFTLLEPTVQKRIGDELVSSITDVSKKLEEIKNRVL